MTTRLGPIFVGGLDRSGKTLLRLALSSHPNIAMTRRTYTWTEVYQRYGDLGLPARPVFDLLLKFAISEDGRLHAEKYYRTVTEEFAVMRPAFRWRQLTALARVSASAFGYSRDDKPGHRAPGYEEACRLLGVTA